MFVSLEPTAKPDQVKLPEILTFEPVINNGSEPNLPNFTVLSANASITGKPAIVLTENNESVKSSSTENKRPLAPSTAKILVLPAEPEPYKTMEPDASWVSFSVKFNELVKDIILEPGVILISGIF